MRAVMRREKSKGRAVLDRVPESGSQGATPPDGRRAAAVASIDAKLALQAPECCRKRRSTPVARLCLGAGGLQREEWVEVGIPTAVSQ